MYLKRFFADLAVDPDDPPAEVQTPTAERGPSDAARGGSARPQPTTAEFLHHRMTAEKCNGACTSCGAPCGSVGFSLEDRQLLTRLEEKFEQLERTVTNVPVDHLRFVDEARQTLAQISRSLVPLSEKDPPTHTSGDREVTDTLLRSGRSVAAIQRATDGDLVWDPSGKYLICRVCVMGDLKKAQCGVFTYDVTDGTSFDTLQKLPVRFKSLRLHVTEHFVSARHRDTKKAHMDKEAKDKARVSVDSSAASRVLRTTYMVLKHSLGHTMFEDLIVLQHLNGADVGNINHSRMMMATARSAFSEAVVDKTREWVSRQPCVSVLADKVTVARRTVDITAVLMMVPDAKPDNIFQSFVIGAPIVKQHDGDALAGDIRDSLQRVGVVASEQISAVAADGQYHHNDVPAKLGRMLDGHSELPAVWDHAHLMNLAESDVRKAPEVAWVQEMVDAMTSVNKRFSVGKGWEELMAFGERCGQRALRPKLWSETRFAAHAAQVVSVFRRNLSLLRGALEEKITAETRPGQLKEMTEELAKLKGETYAAKNAPGLRERWLP